MIRLRITKRHNRADPASPLSETISRTSSLCPTTEVATLVSVVRGSSPVVSPPSGKHSNHLHPSAAPSPALSGTGSRTAEQCSNNLPIGGNGSFTFFYTSHSGATYGRVGCDAASNPTQGCGRIEWHPARQRQCHNIQVVCTNAAKTSGLGVSGANLVNQTRVYGSLGNRLTPPSSRARQNPVGLD